VTAGPSRRARLGALGLALASLALVLGLAEGGARLLAPPRTEPAPSPPEGLPVLRTPLDLARPNARGVFGGVPYRSNGHGVRGPDYAPAPAPGVLRIAVTGDSVTMGAGVAEEDAYPARLERRLDARDPGRRHEVLNLGIAGLNARAAIERLLRLDAAYSPGLAVYGFTVNDIEGPAYTAYEPLAARVERLRRYRESPSHLLRLLGPRLVELAERILPGRESYAEELHRNYFASPRAWSRFAASLDRLAGYARAAGLCAHVFVHTSLERLDETHPYLAIYERVADAAHERGLTASTSFGAFRGRPAPGLWVSPGDPHPNREAHELLAQALEAALAELPARCLEPRSRPPQKSSSSSISSGTEALLRSTQGAPQ
jgi:lysophospholipase L1-like esterase